MERLGQQPQKQPEQVDISLFSIERLRMIGQEALELTDIEEDDEPNIVRGEN